MRKTHQTLYEKIGGEKIINTMIHEFYGRVLADPELKPFFANTSMDKLRSMQREFFSAALDGPVTYTGRPLSHVHHGRGITRHHFSLYIGHLVDTLQGLGLDEPDLQDIIGRIGTYITDITGDTGSVG